MGKLKNMADISDIALNNNEDFIVNDSSGKVDIIPQVNENQIIHSKLGRWLLMISGTICAIIGLVGAFIPVLPTTPFLLLAALCYMRSSRRMYNKLVSNPIFGKPLRWYYEGRGVSAKVKIIAIIFLWFSLSASAILLIPANMWWARLVFLVIAIGVTIHIIYIKPLVVRKEEL
jgi:uncharacterized membrane protein YbaN (DUF454 family)